MDQLLDQIREPKSYTDYDVPRGVYGNRSRQRLRFEEMALQGRLSELSNKRDKLANELHGLITQVKLILPTFLSESVNVYRYTLASAKNYLHFPGS